MPFDPSPTTICTPIEIRQKTPRSLSKRKRGIFDYSEQDAVKLRRFGGYCGGRSRWYDCWCRCGSHGWRHGYNGSRGVRRSNRWHNCPKVALSLGERVGRGDLAGSHRDLHLVLLIVIGHDG